MKLIWPSVNSDNIVEFNRMCTIDVVPHHLFIKLLTSFFGTADCTVEYYWKTGFVGSKISHKFMILYIPKKRQISITVRGTNLNI